MNHDIFGFEKAQDSPGFLLWQVTKNWQRGIKQALEPYNLTHSQYVLLALTYHLSTERVTQKILANYAKMDKMTTSQVVHSLEKKEFVKRVQNKTDEREILVEITSKGLQMLKPAVKAVESFDSEFFAIIDNQSLMIQNLSKLAEH